MTAREGGTGAQGPIEAAQAAALILLRAEMEALVQVLPGVWPAQGWQPATEAEIEDLFDDVPV